MNGNSLSKDWKPAVKDGQIDTTAFLRLFKKPVPNANLTIMDPMEHCAVKAAVSGVMGAGLGVLMAFFMTGMETSSIQEQNKLNELTGKQQMRYYFKQMRARTFSMSKNFGGVGLVYSAIECNVEKYRGTHDMYNALISGMGAGALLAIRAGPGAMLAGGLFFAAFSGAIELYQHTKD